MPRVSVAISTYNDERYIVECLRTIQDQSFQDWEAVIINDGSTDNTDSLISGMAVSEPRFRYYSYKQNRGIVPAVNEAISLAQGEFIARIGTDDKWTDPDKLAKQVKFLDEHPDHVVVGTWAQAINAASEPLYIMNPPAEDKVIRQGLLVRNRFIDTTVLYRKQPALACGAYRMIDLHSEDYGLVLRLGRNGKLANIPQVMAEYRINPKGITQLNAKARVAVAKKLVQENKQYYPGFAKAWVQWQLQSFLLNFGGVKMLNILKRVYYKIAK